MAEIRIEGKTVEFGVDTFFDHLYLVYVDDSGNEFVIRGGPVVSEAAFWPIIVEEGVPISISKDYRPVSERAQHGSHVLDLDGRDTDAVWTQMLRMAELINGADINYNALIAAQNSNSVVASILYGVGIDISSSLPDVPGIDSFPGVNNYLLDDFVRLFSTEHTSDKDDRLNGGNLNDIFAMGQGNDIAQGGAGDDKLKGGDGNDQLFGQDDNDTLIGGKGSDLLDGGEGYDTADYSAAADPDSSGTQGITAALSVNANAVVTGTVIDNWGDTDTLNEMESIIGTSFADTIALSGDSAAITQRLCANRSTCSAFVCSLFRLNAANVLARKYGDFRRKSLICIGYFVGCGDSQPT